MVWIRSALLRVLATAEDDLENFHYTNSNWRSFVSLCQPKTLFVLLWAVLIDKNKLKATDVVCFWSIWFVVISLWSLLVKMCFSKLFSTYNKDYAKAW